MSYILDALRKADAERERDPSRGIHAQPVPPVAAPAGRAVPAWGWVVMAVLLTAAGAYAVRLAGSAPEASLAPAAAAPITAATAMTAAAPAAAAAPATAATPVATAPVPVAAVIRPAAPPMPAPPPPKVVQATPKPLSPPAQIVAGAPAPEPAPAPAAAAGPRIFSVAELPVELQRELPKLAITGGVHSPNPAQRMLIVGGQVVGEGAELAPGLKLEEIRPRAAVLSFRGYKYSVFY